MCELIADTLSKLATWISPKAMPPQTAATASGGRTGSFIDSYRKHRAPTHQELLNELKSTAWTCASINSAVCANFPPKLYVRTDKGQPKALCGTKALRPGHPLTLKHKGMATIEEVTEHPLLTLLQQVNPTHNAFDLWELTQFYLEVHGTAYWLLDFNAFNVPSNIWILPAQMVTPRRSTDSDQLVDYYEYRNNNRVVRYDPGEIICFRLPDPRDPYSSGLSPLRACFEQVSLTSEYAAMRRAIYDNTGIPSVIISPEEVIGEDERDRIETQWNQKFRKGGMGKALVGESNLKVQLLTHSMGDLAALAEVKATKEDIANAFHVPIPYLTGETNLANMQAADSYHMKLCVKPRLKRRDEKINEQLIPLYDPSGRLFVESEDPVPANWQQELQQQKIDLLTGTRTVNEIRSERGLPPVPWGDQPFDMRGKGKA